jgi:hypothetical protein
LISCCEIFHSRTNSNNFSCNVGHCRKMRSRDEDISKLFDESSNKYRLWISGKRHRGWLQTSKYVEGKLMFMAIILFYVGCQWLGTTV